MAEISTIPQSVKGVQYCTVGKRCFGIYLSVVCSANECVTIALFPNHPIDRHSLKMAAANNVAPFKPSAEDRERGDQPISYLEAAKRADRKLLIKLCDDELALLAAGRKITTNLESAVAESIQFIVNVLLFIVVFLSIQILAECFFCLCLKQCWCIVVWNFAFRSIHDFHKLKTPLALELRVPLLNFAFGCVFALLAQLFLS